MSCFIIKIEDVIADSINDLNLKVVPVLPAVSACSSTCSFPQSYSMQTNKSNYSSGEINHNYDQREPSPDFQVSLLNLF